MTKKEAQQIVAAATVVARGSAWGDPPLWQVNVPNGSIDVHAVDEEEARKAAAEALVVLSE
jgi:hypothetical protein